MIFVSSLGFQPHSINLREFQDNQEVQSFSAHGCEVHMQLLSHDRDHLKLFFLQTISSSPALFRQLTCERRETKQTEREGIFSEVSDDGQRLGERGCLK